MQRFAALFLFLSAVPGVLALAVALPVGGPLVALQAALAAAVPLLAGVLYLCLGVDRRLPKRILLPPILFAWWVPLLLWPLPPLLGGSAWPLVAAAGQALLGLGALLRLRRCAARPGVPLPPRFGLRHTLLFFAGSVLLLPLLLVAAGLAAADRLLDGETGGFMRVHPAGIYMTERTYERQGRLVRLVGMVHIGEEEYYRRLAASVGGGRTLVLAEGVSDRDGLLRHRFDYGGVGGALGLVSQERLQFAGRVIEAEEMAAPGEAKRGEEPDVLRADLDVAQFDPRTVDFLNDVGAILAQGGTMADILKDYSVWVGSEMTPELQQVLLDDILRRRNAELLRYLERGLAGYDTLVIPWGAMHMPAIEEALRQQGFVLCRQSVRRSIDFTGLPYARLFRRVAGEG